MMARWQSRALALGLSALMAMTACEGRAPEAPAAVTSASTPHAAPPHQDAAPPEAALVLPAELELPEVERAQIQADAQATAKAEINEANAAQVLDELEAEIRADIDK